MVLQAGALKLQSASKKKLLPTECEKNVRSCISNRKYARLATNQKIIPIVIAIIIIESEMKSRGTRERDRKGESAN